MDLVYTQKGDFIFLYCPSCKDFSVFEILYDKQGKEENGISTRLMSVKCLFCHMSWKNILLYITYYMTLFFNHYLERLGFPSLERPK